MREVELAHLVRRKETDPFFCTFRHYYHYWLANDQNVYDEDEDDEYKKKEMIKSREEP